MKLWTWQTPDFPLTSGRVDHSRSRYYQSLPKIQSAYAELARHIGTCQIIWCYVRPDEYKREAGNSRVEWVLDVPDNNVLAIIDSWVWEKIICSKACPASLLEKWKEEAIQSEQDCRAYIEAKEAAYHAEPPPVGGWWKVLFLRSVSGEAPTVLLRHPIPHGWVVQP